MPRILSVSSSRADIGILLPVWRAVVSRPECELHVLLTGMHQAGGGAVIDGIPEAAAMHRGGADMGGADPVRAGAAMATIMRDTAVLCGRLAPDIMLLTGDRLDMIPAAIATLPFNLPLAHLHGGELTEGAIDDRVRHAMTKLAHLHFVSSQGAGRRVADLGEEAWRIHVTGGPGLDGLYAAPQLSRRDFLDRIGFADTDAAAPLRLVTVHPETNADDPAAPLDAVLAALASRPAATLFTAPNSDPGGLAMRQTILAFTERHPWARFRDTLGPQLYANALDKADVMIGNSSSGVIEASLFGLPVVNIGRRQEGRERAANVRDVASNADALGALLDALGARPARIAAISPYGDGRAAPRIAALLADLPPRSRLLAKRAVK